MSLAGWTIVEMIQLWVVGIFQREPAWHGHLTVWRSPNGPGLVQDQASPTWGDAMTKGT